MRIIRIDVAHAERCPLPFLSSMVEDCIGRGKTVQEGGAIYNFTGPQGFGVANMADSLYAVKKLVFDEKKADDGRTARPRLDNNFGKNRLAKSEAKEITEKIVRGNYGKRHYSEQTADCGNLRKCYFTIWSLPEAQQVKFHEGSMS